MLIFVYQSRFKRDAKKYVNNKKAQEIIMKTLALLQTGQPLPPKYKEHRLSGNYTLWISRCIATARERIPGSIDNYVTGVSECSQQRGNLKDDGYILVIWNVMEHRIYF
ncbi:type II toxin-antitoxin system YafQ family toxin [Photorhabdus bodei]|uniref:Toxin YoeB n=1 Tax=Photorhabdus bodei TaxID=2029681 RepID=A0ABX0ASP1_9GAMM|nr:type II toxin-antitoxin system YafQ family toxin [Photorhabdus bodei]NDL00602.1 hypothetical protein [Photorhabdus bodei]NDL04762.1 hypothetical protein [Photorhabdus bodei]NDL09062.1 hypothetical protein [Photorhabdus bodei]